MLAVETVLSVESLGRVFQKKTGSLPMAYISIPVPKINNSIIRFTDVETKLPLLWTITMFLTDVVNCSFIRIRDIS